MALVLALACVKPGLPVATEIGATIPFSQRSPAPPTAFVAADPGLGEITAVDCRGEFSGRPVPGGIEVAWQGYPGRHAALAEGFPGGWLTHVASCHVQGGSEIAVIPVRFTVTVPPS